MASKKALKRAKITHFAQSDITSCGESLVFDSAELEFSYDLNLCTYDWSDEAEQILHSADPDFVTCKECKSTSEFKKAVKAAKEDE